MKLKNLCLMALALLFCCISGNSIFAQTNGSTYIKAGQVFDAEQAYLESLKQVL